MIDHLLFLDKLRRYMELWIEGNLPREQRRVYQTMQGEMEFNLYMNAPITFQEWLTYPYETREEQEKYLWA